MADKDTDPSPPRSDTAEEKTAECRVGPIKPGFMQCCANVKCWVLLISLFNFFTAFIQLGYLNGVITTIEKQFGISSRQSGLIKSSKEIGDLCAVLFVSYLGGRGHRPLILGATGLLGGVGMVMIGLPHFLLDVYQYTAVSQNRSLAAGLCLAPLNSSVADPSCSAGSGGGSTLVYLMYFGMMFSGVANSAFITLGVSYMDDHAPKNSGPLYFAFFFGLGSAAVALGYLASSASLSVFVDFDRMDTKTLTINPLDSRWIGAWWLAFLVVGAGMITVSLTFFWFPKSLPVEDGKDKEKGTEEVKNDSILQGRFPNALRVEEDKEKGTEEDKKVSVLKGALIQAKSLFTNPVYLSTMTATIFRLALLAGFTLYVPKLIETNFGLTAPAASLYTGAITIPGNTVGVIVGGFIIKRWRMNSLGCAKFLNVCLISACCFWLLNWMTVCDPVSVADSVDRSCASRGCACSDNNLFPVCGADGVTYYSACVAGCKGIQLVNSTTFPFPIQNFTNCECLQAGSWALQGKCRTPCPKWKFPAFMIFTFIMAFLSGIQTPFAFKVEIGCVKKEEKSFSLGIRHLLQRVLSTIPAPVYFGAVIDAACTMWQRSCGNRKACWVYDTRRFLNGFMGLSSGVFIAFMIFWIITYVILNRQYNKDKKIQANTAEGIAAPYETDETKL